MEFHVSNVLVQLVPAVERIKALSEQNTVEFSLAIYSKERPILSFDKETIVILGRLGASLDIDLYIFPKEEGDG